MGAQMCHFFLNKNLEKLIKKRKIVHSNWKKFNYKKKLVFKFKKKFFVKKSYYANKKSLL